MISTGEGTTHHVAAEHEGYREFRGVILPAVVSFALEQLGLTLEDAEVGYLDKAHRLRLDAFVDLSTTEHHECLRDRR